MKIETQILNTIDKHGTTFVELSMLPGVPGDWTMFYEGQGATGIILLENISKEAIAPCSAFPHDY